MYITKHQEYTSKLLQNSLRQVVVLHEESFSALQLVKMPKTLDPEYLKALEPYLPVLKDAPNPPIGDWSSRRPATNGLFDLIMPNWPVMTDVQQEPHTVKSKDGNYDIPLFHFTKKGAQGSSPGTVMLYFHGGGFYAGSVAQYRKVCELYVSQSGIPMIAADYRLAPEFPFPTPVDDAYTVLEYVSKNADLFKIDPSRIVIFGDSAGGGLVAGLAIKARDQGLSPPVAKQMIIGGMLDDRRTAKKDEALAATATWRYEDNVTGWGVYLGSADKIGSNDVSEYASPSRVSDARGLPSLYLEVPDMDIFREENIEYANRLSAANVETELHVWKGVPHSYELFAPRISLSKMAFQLRARAVQSV